VEFQSGTGEIHSIGGATVVDTPRTPPTVVMLRDPYPLPGPGFVQFEYALSAIARVELVLFDVRGRLVRSLVPESSGEAGRHRATWDGRDDGGELVPPGVYFARFTGNGIPTVRRVPLIR
jgi:hypothetical protein